MKPLSEYRFVQLFPSTLDASRLASEALRTFWSDVGVSVGLATQLELCVAEMVNNAYLHAYQGEENKPITVRCYFNQSHPDPELWIEIEDVGDAMSEEELVRAMSNEFIEADPDDERTWTTSGRGFLIVSSLMDKVELRPKGDKNCFLLVKVLDHSEMGELYLS